MGRPVGPVGMFLSAPLTVLVMIVLAQVRGARWIAVLMSADGKPGDYPIQDIVDAPEIERHTQVSDL